MGKKGQISEEKFIKDNRLESYYEKAKTRRPDIWDLLTKIGERYEEYKKNTKGVIQRLSDEIMDDEAFDLSNVAHSFRYRIKDVDSLKVKIVKKIADLAEKESNNPEIEKYRLLDPSNYDRIITDLIGYRIILRYRYQWEMFHQWIKKKFFLGEQMYVSDYLKDYKGSGEKMHLAEQPKVYYRVVEDKAIYEEIGESFYEYKQSDEGYNSVHYVLNIDGKYVELQIRTIFDEAWSECTHDLVYKNYATGKNIVVKKLSKCLADQTIAAEAIVNLMYEVTTNRKKSSKNKTSQRDDKIEEKEKQKAVRYLEMMETDTQSILSSHKNSFDGDVNSFIDSL